MPKKQLSPINLDQKIQYKDVELLKNFITEQGKILPNELKNFIILYFSIEVG